VAGAASPGASHRRRNAAPGTAPPRRPRARRAAGADDDDDAGEGAERAGARAGAPLFDVRVLLYKARLFATLAHCI
jgi:hypothetical protein